MLRAAYLHLVHPPSPINKFTTQTFGKYACSSHTWPQLAKVTCYCHSTNSKVYSRTWRARTSGIPIPVVCWHRPRNDTLINCIISRISKNNCKTLNAQDENWLKEFRYPTYLHLPNCGVFKCIRPSAPRLNGDKYILSNFMHINTNDFWKDSRFIYKRRLPPKRMRDAQSERLCLHRTAADITTSSAESLYSTATDSSSDDASCYFSVSATAIVLPASNHYNQLDSSRVSRRIQAKASGITKTRKKNNASSLM